MGPMIFYIGSIIETYLFNNLNEKRVFKDLADRGYKLKLLDDYEIYIKTTPTVSRFIPIYNLVNTASCILGYNDSISDLINQLNSNNLIEPFNEEERKLYQLNPSVNTAINIAASYYVQRKYSNTIIFKSDLGDTIITYYFDIETMQVKVFSCMGHLGNLDKEDIEELTNLVLETNFQELYDKYGSDCEYFRAIMEGREKPKTLVVNEQDYIIEEKEDNLKLNKKLGDNK